MWRRRLSKCALCLLVAGLIMMPAKAEAWWGFGFPGWGWGGWGGGRNLYGVYRNVYPGGWWGYPSNLGYGAGSFGYGGMYPYAPAYPGGYAYSEQIIFRGYVASGYAPRMRHSLYPALPIAHSPRPIAVPHHGAPDCCARIEVVLPDGHAQVCLDGVATSQTGRVRHFVSPPLAQNSNYVYDVRVSWAGRSQTRQISVTAGSAVTVDFTEE